MEDCAVKPDFQPVQAIIDPGLRQESEPQLLERHPLNSASACDQVLMTSLPER